MALNRPVILLLAPGLTDQEQTQSLQLDDGSYNFYPDRGYLHNYPGKTDLFFREGDLPAYMSTPPSLATIITRLFVFRDGYGAEHIVFVQGNHVCEKIGNGYRVLMYLFGMSYNGRFYPDLFVHEAKLVILNYGDTPSLWDGFEEVQPLGVTEVPMTPELRAHSAPGMNYHIKDSLWAWATIWWPQFQPLSAPALQIKTEANGDETPIDGVYSVVVQFKDKYGNKGRPSAPSVFVTVAHRAEVPAETMWTQDYLMMDWTTPRVDHHLYSTIIGRTVNLQADDDDGGVNKHNIFYVEAEIDNVVESRFVCQSYDFELLDNGAVDKYVLPPAQASMGCSWNGRVFFAGHDDPSVVTWTDKGYHGQCRVEQQHKANDHISRVIPLGDRVVILTRSSVEVLYETAGQVGVLEQNFAHGTVYGRSFVDVGGAIFGLWDVGFGYYDGNKFSFVESPFYIRGMYTDDNHRSFSAISNDDFYMLSLKKDAVSADNNYLLLFYFKTRQWFLLKETVLDLVMWRNQWLGCYDSIYELFRGAYTANAVIKIEGIIPQEASIADTRSLSTIQLLMRESSVGTLEVEVEGRHDTDIGASFRCPLLASVNKLGKYVYTSKYWNQVGVMWAHTLKWSSERDVWITPEMNRPQVGNTHNLTLTFPTGHEIMVKAMALHFTESTFGD